GKTAARRGQLVQVKARGVAPALLQVQAEQHRPRRRIRQIHKKNLVEAPLAQHFRRQNGDVIGSRRQKYAALAVLHPRQQRGQQPLREPCVGVAAGTRGGESLLNLVNPQHHRRKFLRQIQRLPQPLLALAHTLVIPPPRPPPRLFVPPLPPPRARPDAL